MSANVIVGNEAFSFIAAIPWSKFTVIMILHITTCTFFFKRNMTFFIIDQIVKREIKNAFGILAAKIVHT